MEYGEDLPESSKPSSSSKIMDTIMAASDEEDEDHRGICRVCRLAGEQELYHPCQCIGSIKYVHQDCLLKWLKYSKKEVCELCGHRFDFQPVYAKNMPTRLPVGDVLHGIFGFSLQTIRSLFTYGLVSFCWFIFVPLMASRIYKVVFSGHILAAFFSARIFHLFAFENVWVEIISGLCIVSVFLCTCISLVWLREQIMTGAAAGFLHLQDRPSDEAGHGIVDGAANVEQLPDEGLLETGDREDNQAEAHSSAGAPAESSGIGEAESSSSIPVQLPASTSSSPPALIQPQARIAAVEENHAAEAVDEAAVENEAAADGRGDVERIVEDLTWQRLLGLDGSFVFIEHVFWVISLNVVFNLLFLYWPEQLGYIVLKMSGMTNGVIYFQTPLCILIGYGVVIGVARSTHALSQILGLKMLYTLSAIVYLMLKVFLLIVLELILFPIICGWWLDVCSLPLTGGTLDARIKTFQSYSYSSTFLHWIVGMVYVFYSASFILLLKDLLRPGVLWFIRNLNDPDFNPIFEMIDQPVTQHLRRLVSSTTLFFTIILLVVYIPLRALRYVFPDVLPYQFSPSADTPLGEFSLELILLQIVMPTLLEYYKAFSVIKTIVRTWCRVVGGILGLESYLLPASHRTRKDNLAAEAQAVPLVFNAQDAGEHAGNAQLGNGQQQPENARELNMHLAARHRALLMLREPANHEDYEKPNLFVTRIVALLVCLSITAVIVSFSFFLVPVTIGRYLLSYLTSNSQVPVHDLYCIASGLYICWLLVKAYSLSHEWFEKGWSYVKKVFHSTAWIGLKLVAGLIPLLGVIPFMLGLYFQLLVVGPLRASVHQTPLFFPWKEWAMGLVHLKIFCATVMMGPDWWLKTAIERIYTDGVRNFRLKLLYGEMVIPIFNFVSFQLAFPYVVAKIVMCFIPNLSREDEIIWLRYTYPLCLLSLALIAFLAWQWAKLKGLVEEIRKDKYLIGTQLVNFYREAASAVTEANRGTELTGPP